MLFQPTRKDRTLWDTWIFFNIWDLRGEAEMRWASDERGRW